MDLLFLVMGGTLLFYGGDWLIDGIERLAAEFRIPPVIVAFVVMGFGTSAPELFVAVQAMLAAAPDVAVGNVVGSNIANLLLVLALAALIAPVATASDILRIDGCAMLLAALSFGIIAYDAVVSRTDAAMLIVGMTIYLLLRWHSLDDQDSAEPDGTGGLTGAMGWCIAALVALPFGAHLFINAAIGLAGSLGMSEALIGLTAVAIGTSLPEMAACVAAALRRQPDLILGGILGSNVFNGTIVLGSAALVSPVLIADTFIAFWIPIMIGASLVSLIFLRTGFVLSRQEASVMLFGYAVIFLF
ncbi:calcium/sodium antiporter [Tateyamaria omphalii]|uniref:calcium/sodium antiporter n=1 Tax=Tateyamaria omphalii TaxID=299262 RepID=UPI001C99E130|nr:calcium/sodium antiporter [Tateyamaria omphalii]MBY5934768.1 calcium/sodium antiporter [Tateyamaria omphalii]